MGEVGTVDPHDSYGGDELEGSEGGAGYDAAYATFVPVLIHHC